MQQHEPGLLQLVSREGVLINVSVRYWRASKKLAASDVGLDENQINDRLISLGHKKLLPRDSLKNFALIESRAHSLVEANSFPFLNGIARFLPNAKLEEVCRGLEGLKQEFDQEQADFMSNYSDLRTRAYGEWRESARRLMTDPTVFMSNLEQAFPSADSMPKYFSFTHSVFQLEVPDKLTASSVKPELVIARARAAESAKARLDAGVNEFVADAVATLRRETHQLCTDMLASMQGGKTEAVHQKTLNRLVKFIEKFRALNFAGDRDMEQQLETARSQLLTRSAAEYRDSTQAQTALRSGLERLRDEAGRLAQQDTREIVERFGSLGRRKFNLAA